MTRDEQEYIKSWIAKANNDLLSAEKLQTDPPILDTAAFHCQQAIEKFLKAFLIFKGHDIQRTHNIDYLLAQCSLFDIEFNTIDPLNINEFAVNGRYPDDDLEVTPEEIKSFYKLAQQVKTMVTEKMVFS